MCRATAPFGKSMVGNMIAAYYSKAANLLPFTNRQRYNHEVK